MPADKTGEMWNVTPTWWEDATMPPDRRDCARIGKTLANLWDYLDANETKWAEACRDVSVDDNCIGLEIDVANSSVTTRDVEDLAAVLEATPPKGLDPERSTEEE